MVHRTLESIITLAATGCILLGCETSNTSTGLTAEPTIMTANHASPPAPLHTPEPAPKSLQVPGFASFIDDGRLWVFADGSQDMAEFLRSGEPAKSITRIGAGPGGITIRSVDAETIDAYLTSRPGFETIIKDGRLWVFKSSDIENIAEFKRTGEPAKSVTRIGAGPRGMTIRSVDGATIDAYLTSRPGFETFIKDGRLWVFRSLDTENISEFLRTGEPAKSVTRIGAGPNGMTIRSVDGESIDAYLAARPGFETFITDGRLWVFRAWDVENVTEFLRTGEPAKSVTRIGAGPNGMTIRSVDAASLDAYLAMP